MVYRYMYMHHASKARTSGRALAWISSVICRSLSCRLSFEEPAAVDVVKRV